MTHREWAPVQGSMHIPAGRVPWAVHVLAWEAYHERFPEQSAEQIADRSGFSWEELVTFLRGNNSFEGVADVSRALTVAATPQKEAER